MWWALAEVGWLDEHLIGQLGRTPPAQGAEEIQWQLRKLTRLHWLANERPTGRPARPLALTPFGRARVARISRQAPPWTAPTREVVRRGLATVFGAAEQPIPAPEAARRVMAIGRRWGRAVNAVDVRMVLVHWRRERVLRTTSPQPRVWRPTEVGVRAFRALARATGEPLPRHSPQQGGLHDQLLASAALRMATHTPGVIGVIRLARRVHLDGPQERWIVPDGLVGFETGAGPVVVALEVERRDPSIGLARHIANYGLLAHQWRSRRLCVAVVNTRVTVARRAFLERAARLAVATNPGIRLTVTALTVPMLTAWLDEQGVQPDSPVFAPVG